MDTRTHPSTGFQRNQRAETIQISSWVKRIPESENLLRAPSGQHIRRVHRVCLLTYNVVATTVVLTGIDVVVSAIACLYSLVGWLTRQKRGFGTLLRIYRVNH